MALCYIPIFFDWLEVTEALSDEEKGRLVDALILYARGEDWQSKLNGNEKILFPALRKMIDRSAEISERRRVAGSSGGKQTQANSSKFKQIQATSTEEEKEKEKEEENNNIIREFDTLWKLYPKRQGKKKALACYIRDRKKHSFEEIKKGVEAYAAYCKAERIEDRYIKQGATFFSQAAWEADNQWVSHHSYGSTGKRLLPEDERDQELLF